MQVIKVKLLVLGADSLLGRALVQHLQNQAVEFHALQTQDLDLLRKMDVIKAINAVRPDQVVNVATYSNLDVEETYPAFLPNLYADKPIVLYGRCKPGQNVTIQIEGRIPYAGRTLQFSHTPGAPDPARADIAHEWARQKIHHIVADMARAGETSALRAEIERIGREYGVRTPYDR